MPETEIADEISRKPEVREELQRTGEKEPGQKIKAAAADKFWFVTHGLLLLGCARYLLLDYFEANSAPASPSGTKSAASSRIRSCCDSPNACEVGPSLRDWSN